MHGHLGTKGGHMFGKIVARLIVQASNPFQHHFAHGQMQPLAVIGSKLLC